MPCDFQQFQRSPLLQEQHLKSKICELQTQLMEFNRHISPAKEKQTTTVTTQHETREEGSWQHFWFVFCLLSFLKTSITLIGGVMYIVWPLCFPTFVYMGEGCTYFFWQVASVSILVSVAMLIKMASDINELRCKYTKKLSRKMKAIANRCVECGSELDNFTKKLIVIALVSGVSLLLIILVYKESIEAKYIIGAILLATGFCFGMTYGKQRNRGYEGILPLINCDEAVSLSPIPQCPVATSTPAWLHILDFAREHGFTPLKYHRSPPPTYREAVEDYIPPHKSPACRTALFQ